MDLVATVRAHPKFPALQGLGAVGSSRSSSMLAKEIARELGVTAGLVRDIALGSSTSIAESIRALSSRSAPGDPRTSTFAGVSGLGAAMNLRLRALGPARLAERLRDLVDGTRGVDGALADGRIELHEVWNLIELARDLGGVTRKERADLARLLQDHGARFEPLARATLLRFLALADPNAPVASPQPSHALRALWDTARIGFPADALALPTNAPPGDALERAKELYSVSTDASRREATRVAAFYQAYPSNGGAQIVAFHSQWATWDTLSRNPLQGWLYHSTRPFDDAGAPRGARWQAYVHAIETGAPNAVVEEAFLRAHVHDLQSVVRDPTFVKLAELSSPDYRKVVEAYVETLKNLEARLDGGDDPVKVARALTPETFRCLLKRGTLGMIWTPEVFTQSFDFTNPTTRNMWRAYWDIAKNVVFGVGKQAPTAIKLAVSLTAEQARDLTRKTGVAFQAGEKTLTPSSFDGARFTDELDRREDKSGPLRSYPLRFEDLAGTRKMRGLRHAGTDGVLQCDEIDGAVRGLTARARSQLIAEFHAKYPVPQGGILLYSANMLAMNGAYAEHAMFGDLPNRIMPVDNDGKPKNALWRAFVDASTSHAASGAPSQEQLEMLWLRAHMKDFEAVDTPEFRAKLDDFWQQAALDPVMAPMAIYTKAMLLGRTEFEKSTTGGLPEEVAFKRSLEHFARTMLEHRTFPFWQSDLRELGRLLFDPEVRAQPDVDDRGLATDKALIERSIAGIKEMFGLARMVLKGHQLEQVGELERVPTNKMVDLSRVLPPAKLAQLDPKIIAFYDNPLNFDVTTGVSMPWLNRIVMGGMGSLISGQGQIPDRVRGFEGYPLEMDLYQDPAGHTHWDRHVVVDGKRRTLFHAKFEVDGAQLKETFTVAGREVELYFNADVTGGKLVLSMDATKSDKLARCSAITFSTQVTAAGSLETTGDYVGTGLDCTGTITFLVTPK
jgi:hypothetical protein